MEQVTEFIKNNQDIIVAILGFLLLHFSASITVATTKTKESKWYKLLEVLALCFGKAKEKAKEDKKVE